LRRWLLGLLLFCVASVAGAGLWIRSALEPVNPKDPAPVTVTVPAGASTTQAADLLHGAGLIKSPLVFRLWVRSEGKDGEIKPGEYEFTRQMNTEQILTKLVKGEVVIRKVVVPEGFTIAEIANQVAASGAATKEAFLKAVHDPAFFPPDLPAGVTLEEPLEGYLFPATYPWERGMTAEALVKTFRQRFDALWTDEWKARLQASGLSLHQAVTLASIVEAEAVKPQEMPRIAGVYLNRLRSGWLLQADPTVYYALKKPKSEPLLYKDLEVDSPYNTYKVAGLPPGPIGAPGKAALEAVLYPESHDFYFFVAKADGSGEHYFAHSLEEHNANVARAEENAKQHP
jgi:UPF0755 protein